MIDADGNYIYTPDTAGGEGTDRFEIVVEHRDTGVTKSSELSFEVVLNGSGGIQPLAFFDDGGGAIPDAALGDASDDREIPGHPDADAAFVAADFLASSQDDDLGSGSHAV